jgi:UDP-N-acetylglucosamine acyltransferase
MTAIVGNHVILANYVGLAGHTVIGDYVAFGGMCVVHQFVRIGAPRLYRRAEHDRWRRDSLWHGGGQPGAAAGLNLVGLKRRKFDRE